VSLRVGAAKLRVKRWARHAVIRGSGLIHPARGRLSRGLRILTYHRVADADADPFSVPPRDFGEQMRLLAETKAVLPLHEALTFLGRGEMGVPRVVLTFDDGTSDFLEEALPVLSRFGLPATLYVSPGLVGRRGYLGWNDLASVAESSGVSLGSHGLDHRSLGRLEPEEIREQVIRSRHLLEDRLGRRVITLAYPFGTRRDYDERVKQLVREAGYQAACTSMNGVNESGADRYELKRTKIENSDGPLFPRILAGGLDAWFLVDRYLWSLQNRYA
jgi:peptidoglycan/xylan/chitin deacetylase (PgdA/CDA1 family)